jgi:uncharacterized phage protein gp47/JayE
MSYSLTATPTWPIPTPATLFNNAATVYETNPALAGIDARSSFSVAGTNCRVYAMGSYDRYLMIANLAQELMVDTAVVWLPRHANIWNVPRLQPTAATGYATFTGQASLSAPVNIPSGTMLSAPAGYLYMTTASATVGAGAAVAVPVSSVLGGSAYNLAGSTTLSLVSAIAGLAGQSAVLNSSGALNGTDLEAIPHWRGRIQAKIQQPPCGGSLNDYLNWCSDQGIAYYNVLPNAVGAGSVGIYIADAGPSVASDSDVDALQNYLGVYNGVPGVRPVTARVLVMAATLAPVNVTMSLNPNTATTQAAATNALQLFFQQLAASYKTAALAGGAGGVTLFFSRLENAISNGSGAFSQELTAPAADVTFLASQIPTLGTVTFE